jgi:hypothetical protein
MDAGWLAAPLTIQVSDPTSLLLTTSGVYSSYHPLVFFLLLPSTEPPFDRHDWIVKRPETGEEVRYVIDYYEAPPLPDGSPVFSLDVRPALDNLSSVKERISVATEEAWAAFKQNQSEAATPRRDATA